MAKGTLVPDQGTRSAAQAKQALKSAKLTLLNTRLRAEAGKESMTPKKHYADAHKVTRETRI